MNHFVSQRNKKQKVDSSPSNTQEIEGKAGSALNPCLSKNAASIAPDKQQVATATQSSAPVNSTVKTNTALPGNQKKAIRSGGAANLFKSAMTGLNKK